MMTLNPPSHHCPHIYIPGSGKTLSYLAPLISRLKDEEEHHGVMARLKRPRALIILPSRDLAAQVLVSTNIQLFLSILFSLTFKGSD